MIRSITGIPGPSGFGSASTADQVTLGIDASNLTAIVTGGASGIGLETVRVLAQRKVHVIIAARNTDAAKDAKDLILRDNRTAKVDIMKLDLNSIRSIKAFSDDFKALRLPLNILINNAGIMFCPFQLSEDGYEMQFATNHLGHFYLTNLLLDRMKETAKATGIEGRIVNLSSIAHRYPYRKGIRFDKINDKKSYDDKMAYGQSKLANILHANELSRRLQEEGANITVNSVHPGVIMTNLMRHSTITMSMYQHIIYTNLNALIYGAATTCYVALHPDMKGVTGKYFVDCNECKPTKLARSEALGKELWDFSNQLIHEAQKK
nr:short-chain dehydrogenase TIC 32, chloroplastic-like [Ipomoea batatas]